MTSAVSLGGMTDGANNGMLAITNEKLVLVRLRSLNAADGVVIGIRLLAKSAAQTVSP